MRERYEPKDLFEEVKEQINLVGGTITGDDTVIDKPYSDPSLTELIGYFWSGKHHRIVKGIQLITLYYTELSGKSVPINYRIYNKQEGKTKNDYLREMLKEVLDWGVQPKMVTTDAWYSSHSNLQFLKHKGLGLLMGIAKNRLVTINGQKPIQVQALEIPDEGLLVHLKKFGNVKVFRKQFKNEVTRYYIMYLPDLEATKQLTRVEFKKYRELHWGIECYHRALKQVCGISNFMVRKSEAIITHFFCAIRAFTQLELMRAEELIANWYSLQRTLSLKVAREFILEHLKQKIEPTAYH